MNNNEAQKMTKTAYEKIAAGLEDAIAFAEGAADPAAYRVTIPAFVDVRSIRARRGMTQEAFAAAYGFTLGRLRDWEQNRSSPDGPSRILLTIIDREPEAVERALKSA